MLKMSRSMTLKERFKGLIKNYEAARNLNEYLRKQLAHSVRTQRRNLHETPSFTVSKASQEEGEEESNPFPSSSEKECRRPSKNCRDPNHFQDFMVKIQSLKVVWIPINFKNGSEPLREFLSTRMCLKTRS